MQAARATKPVLFAGSAGHFAGLSDVTGPSRHLRAGWLGESRSHFAHEQTVKLSLHAARNCVAPFLLELPVAACQINTGAKCPSAFVADLASTGVVPGIQIWICDRFHEFVRRHIR